MNVPWPTTWMRFQDLGWRIFGVVAAVGGGSLLLAVLCYSTPARSLSLLFLLFALSVTLGGIGAYVTTGMAARRRSQAAHQIRLRDGSPCVFLPTLVMAEVLLTAGAGVGAVALVLCPWVVNMVPVRGSRGDLAMRAIAPVACVLGLVLLGWCLGRFLRKRRSLGVGLSPTGVYHWAWLGCCFYSWDSIKRMSSVPEGAPSVRLTVRRIMDRATDPEENFLAETRWYRHKATRIPVNQLAVNPAVAYLALEFYRRHPELRDELAGEEGLRRVWTVDFPDLVEELRARGKLILNGA